MPGLQELRGRIAVVTGGGSGIGRGMCRRFAAEGMDVAVADIERAAAEKVAEELRSSGVRSVGVACDVADAPRSSSSTMALIFAQRRSSR